MQALTCERPGAGDAGPRKLISLGKLIVSEDSTPTDRQAIRLSRRFALPLATARTVALLAYGEAMS